MTQAEGPSGPAVIVGECTKVEDDPSLPLGNTYLELGTPFGYQLVEYESFIDAHTKQAKAKAGVSSEST